MCVKGFSFAVICLLFISGFSASQQTSSTGSLQSGKTKRTIINYQPGHSYLTVRTGDSLRVIDEDMTQMAEVIVEFKQDPFFIQQSKNKLNKTSPLLYKSQQTQFSSDLTALYKIAVKSYSVNLAMPQKKAEYYKVFNGASLSIPGAMIAPVASLPYVKKVHINKSVQIDLDESVNLIGAETVWSAYNTRGEGVVIGIIDTGIDYLHPALGEGIGPGYKVIGGYDFVNKDNDPIDDHGHGTHVAGIAAANNSVIKGVAPGAWLFALKALDAYGRGLESDIISAIEMTVDPDNNESTDDKLDVVNMSLGSREGDPFDAMTAAVNNAVKLGVTYCISAGNSGDFNTIGSPGTAELAITVGASDKLDYLALFSSRGPVKKTFIIKPDVLAPGVSIRSSYKGGIYESLNGTSMAAPHAAGACALLKQLHRDWSPGMIKSALMTTAKNLALDFMEQGAGRINVFDASKVSTFAVPSQVSFGLDTLGSGLLKSSDTIEVINKSEFQQTYNISVYGLFAGVRISPDKSSFIIQPGASQKVVFTLSDDGTVPYLNEKKPAYEGRIGIVGSYESFSLPWTFVKLPVLSVSFEKPYDKFALYGKEKLFFKWNDGEAEDLYNSQFVVPVGTYDLLVYFNNIADAEAEHRIVEKPAIKMNGPVKITVSPSEADKVIKFSGTDEIGSAFASLPNSFNNLHVVYPVPRLDPFIYFPAMYEFNLRMKPGEKMKSSILSDSIKLYAGQFQCDLKQEHTARVLNYPRQVGLKGDMEFRNENSKYLRLNIEARKLPDSRSVLGIGDVFLSQNGYFMYIDSLNMTKEKKWNGQLLLSSPESDCYYSAEVFSVNSEGFRNDYSKSVHWEAGPVHFDETRTIMMINWGGRPALRNNDILKLGDGPVFPTLYSGRFASSSDSISCMFIDIIDQNFLYRESAEANMFVSVFDANDKLIKKDSVDLYNGIEILNGSHKYDIYTKYYTVGGVWGKAEYITSASSLKDIESSPRISSLQVLDQKGAPSSILRQMEKGRIVFSAKQGYNLSDDLDTINSALYLKRNGGLVWEKQTIFSKKENYEYLFFAETGSFTETDSSLIDLKVVLKNKNGQEVQWSLEPAFAVGDYNYKSIIEPGHELDVIPGNYVLYNNYPNPFNPSTVISYGIPAASHVEIKIFDILGREVNTLLNKEQEAGEYKITFNAGSLSSGVYLCRIRAGNFVKTQKLLLIR